MKRQVPNSASDNRRASAAVELAVLLPFLGLMFTAALDFARVYYATQTLEQCASAGAMYAIGTAWTSASTGRTQAAQNAAVANGGSLSPALQPENVTVATDAAGNATVTAAYDFALLTPILSPSGRLHLRRSATVNKAPVPGS